MKALKTENKKIHMLNARNNIIMTVINKVNKGLNIFEEINNEFTIFLDMLENKGIEYSKLSRALIPSRDEDKYEYAFVFNSTYFNDKTMFYGEKIMNKILSIINKESTQSILAGDYIKIQGVNENSLRNLFLEKIEYINKCDYLHNNEYYIVYINNITKKQLNDMIGDLKNESYFVGVMNLKYTSGIKQYLSYILCQICIKYKNKVILPHFIDRDDKENYKEQGYAYKENGFDIISINQMYYELFLAYKIPNGIKDEEDLKFSYNLLTYITPKYEKIKVIIDERKLKYLMTKKTDDMKTLGLLNVTKEELEKKILINIYNNYIYNIEKNEFGDLKFNVLIELFENSERKNALISLKYIPEKNELKLITMY